MTPELRQRAFDLYHGPFKHEHGYIWDARGEMVADDRIEGAVETPVSRVRGWGRIGYLPDAAALQDTVGQLVAEALTKLWAEAREAKRARKPTVRSK